MYSQTNEEKIIVDYFDGCVGRFLDLGAHDGRTNSNTLRLAELGWEGVCVEPVSIACDKMRKEHEGRPVKVVQAAVGLSSGTVEFFNCVDSQLSTTRPDFVEHVISQWGPDMAAKFSKEIVAQVTVRDILRDHGSCFDFVSVDVEGNNLEILRSLPLDAMRTQLVCVEHFPKDRIQRYIERELRWDIIAMTGENFLAAPKEPK